jgi:citronellol/citronellal dehydrogenase
MAAPDSSTLLRRGLLEGMRLISARAEQNAGAEADSAVALESLGARVARCPLDAGGELGLDQAAEIEQEVDGVVAASLAELDGAADVLLLDGGGFFTAAGGREPLLSCLQACWTLTRAVANAAFLPDGRGGRVVLIAPADGAEHSRAAAAGLENLARTLATEWARYAITIVAVAPGRSPAADELSTLLAYLASPAGAYFSGCLLDMRGGPAA